MDDKDIMNIYRNLEELSYLVNAAKINGEFKFYDPVIERYNRHKHRLPQILSADDLIEIYIYSKNELGKKIKNKLNEDILKRIKEFCTRDVQNIIDSLD